MVSAVVIFDNTATADTGQFEISNAQWYTNSINIGGTALTIDAVVAKVAHTGTLPTQPLVVRVCGDNAGVPDMAACSAFTTGTAITSTPTNITYTGNYPAAANAKVYLVLSSAASTNGDYYLWRTYGGLLANSGMGWASPPPTWTMGADSRYLIWSMSGSPPVVNGACAVSATPVVAAPSGVSACTTGTVSGAASSASQFTWNCSGSGGGSTANNCSVPHGYTVTPSASANGSISPNTPQVIGYNTTTSFTVTPTNSNFLASVGGSCGGNLSGTNYTTSAIIGNCTVDASFVPTVSQASIPTRASGVTATLAAIGCSTVSNAVFIDAPAGKPTNTNFPFGLLDFTLNGCNSSVIVTVTYSQAIPAGATYYKETGGVYSPFAATVGSNSVTFTLVDGGTGDSDGSVNGSIHDPSGIGVGGVTATIPTLSEWGLIGLSALMALFGIGQMRRRRGESL